MSALIYYRLIRLSKQGIPSLAQVVVLIFAQSVGVFRLSLRLRKVQNLKSRSDGTLCLTGLGGIPSKVNRKEHPACRGTAEVLTKIKVVAPKYKFRHRVPSFI